MILLFKAINLFVGRIVVRLFIIGNGFDIDHGLETTFKDFKDFLEISYLPSFNREFTPYPDIVEGNDGEVVVNPNSASQILYSLINATSSSQDWKDFEECLGNIDYQIVLDLVDKNEENLFHYYYNLEDIVNNLKQTMLFSISGIFCEWVTEIDITNAKKKYKFHDDDLFLTFNYTEVLEDIYHINSSNICHIHGSRKEKHCVVGHGNIDRSFNEYDDIVSFQINEIHNLLIKDVEDLYYKNHTFFERLYKTNIDEIVFFGLSKNDIDAYYLEKIFSNMNSKDIRLYFSKFEHSNEKNDKLTWLGHLGFEGKYAGWFI